MHMRAEGLDSARKPLQLLDEFGIALDWRHFCISPVADGMRSGTGKHRTAIDGDLLKLRDSCSKVGLRLGHRAADAGDYLDGRLHELKVNFRVLARVTQAGQCGKH